MKAKKKVTPRGRAKKSNKKTYIAIVLDRSGSMAPVHEATVKGLNKQFEAIQKNGKAAGDTEVSLIQFDTEVETVFDGKKPEQLGEYAMDDFDPRGRTAMYDGIWNAIRQLKAKKATDDTAYLICVISDGEENASKEITQDILGDEIKKLQDQGNWTFTYLLSNVDITKMRSVLNSDIGNMAYYNSTTSGTAAAYTVSANSTMNYLSTRGTVGARSTNTSYTAYSADDIKKLVDTR